MNFELKKQYKNNDLIIYDTVFDRYLIYLNDFYPYCLTSKPDYIFDTFKECVEFIKDLYYPSLEVIRRTGTKPRAWEDEENAF